MEKELARPRQDCSTQLLEVRLCVNGGDVDSAEATRVGEERKDVSVELAQGGGDEVELGPVLRGRERDALKPRRGAEHVGPVKDDGRDVRQRLARVHVRRDGHHAHEAATLHAPATATTCWKMRNFEPENVGNWLKRYSFSGVACDGRRDPPRRRQPLHHNTSFGQIELRGPRRPSAPLTRASDQERVASMRTSPCPIQRPRYLVEPITTISYRWRVHDAFRCR